jgi:mRNA-degrading endonuclease RelE of RelBE toxin-antitoxin system
MYDILYSAGVAADLRNLRAFDRRRLLDTIQEQLTWQPLGRSRNRKPLIGLIPPWEHREPVWELRVGEHRVFYDVDESERRVMVRAVRRKPPGRRTEDIL